MDGVSRPAPATRATGATRPAASTWDVLDQPARDGDRRHAAGGDGPGRDIVAAAAWAAAGVDLAAVTAAADLQTRVDRKYLLTTGDFAALAPALTAHATVLEIGGRRAFAYESVYFDTPDLLTYRQHLQGRRRRYKIRTRTYADAGDCLLEVKCAGARDSTVKHRAPYPAAARGLLTATGRSFVARALAASYGLPAPAGLAPVLTTAYRRVTFADPAAGLRVTCDTDLAVIPTAGAGGGGATPGWTLRAAPDLVIVEVKAAHPGSPAERVLRRHRVRPIGMSKYCAAVAALRAHGWGPPLATNPWHRAARRLRLAP